MDVVVACFTMAAKSGMPFDPENLINNFRVMSETPHDIPFELFTTGLGQLVEVIRQWLPRNRALTHCDTCCPAACRPPGRWIGPRCARYR